MKLFSSLFLLLLLILFSGCDQKKDVQPQQPGTTEQDNTSNTNAGNSTKGTDTTVNRIIREGIIDLSSVDQNNDKKVYQCPMDWNVIDDKPGTCPLCKMDLEEFSLTEAKNNLVKNDYQVK